MPNECPVVNCSRRPDQPHKIPGCRVVALSWVTPVESYTSASPKNIYYPNWHALWANSPWSYEGTIYRPASCVSPLRVRIGGYIPRSLWRMTSAPPGLRLPTQLQSTGLCLYERNGVFSSTAWRQRQVCVSGLSTAVSDSAGRVSWNQPRVGHGSIFADPIQSNPIQK